MKQGAIDTVKKYYDAFNRGSMEEFFSLLTDDVVHEINQGGQEIGKETFSNFLLKGSIYPQIKDYLQLMVKDIDFVAEHFFS